MIDRYARPRHENGVVGGEQEQQAPGGVGRVRGVDRGGRYPPEDMVKLRNAQYDKVRLQEVFQRTRHDMTAFLQSVTGGLGDEGRWIHMASLPRRAGYRPGLQLIEASDILLEDVDCLLEAIQKKGRGAQVHADDGPHPRSPRRAHYLRSEAGHLVGRDAAEPAPTAGGQKERRCGQDIRSRWNLRHSTAPDRGAGLLQTWLGHRDVSNQIVQRDRHAQFVTTLALIAASLEKFATEIRGLQRTEVREAEEPFGEGQTGSSAMPHKRNPELSERVCGPGQANSGPRRDRPGKRGPVARAGHQPLLCRAPHSPRLLHGAGLHHEHLHGRDNGLRVYPDR